MQAVRPRSRPRLAALSLAASLIPALAGIALAQTQPAAPRTKATIAKKARPARSRPAATPPAAATTPPATAASQPDTAPQDAPGAPPAEGTPDPAARPAGGNPLDIPEDVQVFGKFDPNIRKATAIVNGFIITDTDVDQRLNLVLAAGNRDVPASERDQLRLQVLRNLVDETLQIQEGKANDVTVPAADIDQTFARVAGQFKQSPQQFSDFLKSKGSSAASMKRQIEGEVAWQRVLGRKVEPFVNVGEDEVKGVMARLAASKGAKEYHVGEIYMSSTPANDAQVHANIDRIFEQLKKGGSFVAYARQYSEASTAAVGGDLGWVRAEQLPEALAAALPDLQPGQVAAPIQVPGGYSIIAVTDTRQVLTADPRDALLSLKQITITFPKGATQASATPKVAALAEATKAMAGCGAAKDVAARLNANVVENDDVKVRDLPPQLQSQLSAMLIGQSTTPFGSLEDGVRVLVLCGRDDPQEARAPSFDAIYNQMSEERVNLRARRYLRDLRRDAVIEYR